jgi:hypothetical protein
MPHWAALKEHLISAVAGAALLGGGATVIGNKVELADHSRQLDAVTLMASDLRDIRNGMNKTQTDVAVIRTTVELNHTAVRKVAEKVQ